MRNLISIPLLAATVIFQSAIVSRVELLSGYADIMLVILIAWALQEQVKSAWHWALLGSLLTGFLTRLPWLVVFVGYFACIYLARGLSRRIWQAPLAAMFSVTFLGTLFFHLISYITLSISGVNLPIREVIGSITLPSLLLNMLLAVPVFIIMRDISQWVYPAPEAV